MIFCSNQIYGKVWNITRPEGKNYMELRISTREKGQDGQVTYSSWFPRVIGHAFNSLKDLKEGDNILITKAKLTNEGYTDKEGNKKSAFRFVIMEATIQNENNQSTAPSDAPAVNEEENPKDDSCPW